MGAVVMNGFARGIWTTTDEVVGLRKVTQVYEPHHTPNMDTLYDGWRKAVRSLSTIP